jgi:ABC-type transport system involved in multi-copper enzyme maturation permease subunit
LSPIEEFLKLFGPVLFYDLIRVARRGRYILLRCLYAILLLLLMYAVYDRHFTSAASQSPVGTTLQIQQNMLAAFAEKFFGAFLAVQFLAVVLLTPAYTAGAIAEEKQRQTIEYLFATDLGNQEIIFGKLAARIGNLTLFIITGLPILSLTQLFGGITPMLLWCGFAATALTMLSVASLSILQSVYAKRVRDAMTRTYILVVGYFVGWGILEMVRLLLTMDPPAPVVVTDLFDRFIRVYNTGNPAAAFVELVQHVRRTGSFGWKPVLQLAWYGLFHGTLTAICMGLSVARLRSAYIRQVYGKTVKAMKQAVAVRPPKRVRRKPPVSEHPMVWKELYAEKGLRLGLLGELAFILIALATICPAIVLGGIVVLEWYHGSGGLEHYARNLNMYVRIVGTILSGFIMVGVGIRAAGSIGAERDKLTYESLMSSTLTNREILLGKWLGAVAGMRWVYALLGFVWVLAVATGGIHWFAFFMVVAVLGICVALSASLGLWFGSASKTGLRASLWAVVALLALQLLPVLAGSILKSADGTSPVRALSPGVIVYYLSFGYPQADVLSGAESAIRDGDRQLAPDQMTRSEVVVTYLCFLGVFLLALGVAAASMSAAVSFRRHCGRTHGRPHLEPIDTGQRIHT